MRRHLPDPFDPLDGPIAREFDLHGLTAVEARKALEQFLGRARRGALVHIITGKGRNSPGGPVLRTMIRGMLNSGTLSRVAAWGPDDHDGGFLIRIKV